MNCKRIELNKFDFIYPNIQVQQTTGTIALLYVKVLKIIFSGITTSVIIRLDEQCW